MKVGRARIASAAAVLAASLLTTGCWGLQPVEKTGLVAVMGIDLATGGYEVSLLVGRPSGTPTSGGLGGSSHGKPATLDEAAAPTVGQAINHLRAATPLALNFTHLEVLVVSAALARSGLAAPLALLATSRHEVETPWLLVARGTSAVSILQALVGELPRPGGVAVDTITQARQGSPYQAGHLFTLFDEMNLEGDEFATAGARLRTTANGPRLAMDGVGLFRADRLVGWLDGGAALGWLLATGRASRPVLTVPSPDGPVGLQIKGDRRTIRVRRGPAGPVATIGIRVLADVVTLPPGPADFWRDPGQQAALRSAAAATIADDVSAALAAARSAGADVFSLGEFVRVSDPALWEADRATWNTSGFPHLPVRVSVQVALSSLGETVCPSLGSC